MSLGLAFLCQKGVVDLQVKVVTWLQRRVIIIGASAQPLFLLRNTLHEVLENHK